MRRNKGRWEKQNNYNDRDEKKNTIKRRGKEKLLGAPHFVPKFLQNLQVLQ